MNGPNGCWIWTGSKHVAGYGEFRWNGALYRTHQVAYEAFNSKIPDGLQVNHKCDNPPCCNPEHLYAGTHQQNMNDIVTRGRHWKAILYHTDIHIIQRLLKKGLNQTYIGEMFGVSQMTISAIKNGRLWKHTL